MANKLLTVATTASNQNTSQQTTTTVQHTPTSATIQNAPTTSTMVQHGSTTTNVVQHNPITPTTVQHTPTTLTTVQHAPTTSTSVQHISTTSTTVQHTPTTSTTVQHAPTTLSSSSSSYLGWISRKCGPFTSFKPLVTQNPLSTQLPSSIKHNSKPLTDQVNLQGRQIQIEWNNEAHSPDQREFELAARLAMRGHLPSVKFMKLKNHLDLAFIPDEYLTELTFCVEKKIILVDIRQTKLSPILRGIKCKEMELYYTTLSESDTYLLVKALNDSVELLMLYEGFVCDIQTLLQYSGSKTCRTIVVRSGSYQRYGLQLWEYAKSKGWTTEENFNNQHLIITRKSIN